MKKQPAKTVKIAVVDNPTVVWCPSPGKPCEYLHKPYIARNESLAYIFADVSMGH